MKLFLIELSYGEWIAKQFGTFTDSSWVCVNEHSVTGRRVSYYSEAIFMRVNNAWAEKKLRAAGLWIEENK